MGAPKKDFEAANKGLSLADKIAIVWFILDAFTHLTIELAYVFVTVVYGGSKYSDSPLAFMWNEYGKADKRWAVYDSNVLSLELLTVFGMGPLALLMIYLIVKQSPWRHFAQVVICTSELYGGWMTFAPEWVSGNENLSGAFLHVWVYLFFMNFVWVLIPAILLVDSGIILAKAQQFAKPHLDKPENQTPVGNGWYYLIAFTLVVYAVAVPGVLLYAQKNPIV